MNQEELYKKFEKNVEYLRRNIPPDDIYLFAEQTIMACMFFLHKWSQHVDLEEEMECPITHKWINNIVGFQLTRDAGQDVQLDLNLKEFEDL